MRHRVAHRKLGRTTPHRMSLLRNLAASLIRSDKGRIRTTEAKAKELRPFVEKLVTLGKRDSLHARRRALSILPRKEAVQKLFSEISPRFSERPGGYTRILKLGHRQGDGAAMAFIEFVDFKFEGASGAPAAPAPKAEKTEKAEKAEKPPKTKAKAKSAKKAKADEPEEASVADSEEGTEEEKPAKKKRATRKKKTEE